MGKWFKKLEQWIGGGGQGSGGRINTFRWLIIVGLIGVAIILFNSFVNVKKLDNENIGREPPTQATVKESAQDSGGDRNAFASIEEDAENKMKEILEKIVGVGTVDVMVNVDSTDEVVYQKNMKDSQQQSDENDANGGKRRTTQYTRDGEVVTYEQSGTQAPIVTKRVKPQIRGVLVVAKGAENEVVKQLIVDAVEKGLNVPEYRISVVPRKQG